MPSSLRHLLAVVASSVALFVLALTPACYPAKDCQAACSNVLACQSVGYDDGDLQLTTFEACVASCQSNEVLTYCFDDCSPSDLEIRWRCATGESDCSALDHTCDVY